MSADAGAGSPCRVHGLSGGALTSEAKVGASCSRAAGEWPLREDADLQEYGQSLGVDLAQNEDLLWVVQEAFQGPPFQVGCAECTDDVGRVYFFQEISGQSSWEHPMDSVYRELLGLVRQLREGEPGASKDQRAAFVHDHLKQVHQRALRALEAWSGPYTSAEGEYYYNETHKASTWECPVSSWEQELATRHAVLCRCLLPEDLVVGADGSVAAAAGAGLAGAAGPELLQSLHLPLGLVRRDGGDVPETPSTRSFHTARSAYSARSQHRSSPRRSPGRAPSPPPAAIAATAPRGPGGSTQGSAADAPDTGGSVGCSGGRGAWER